MAEFRVFIRGRVQGGQIGTFRDLGRRMTGFVREDEPGTVAYGWFVSDDGRFVTEDGYAEDAVRHTHGQRSETGFPRRVPGIARCRTCRSAG